ncbi:MAG: polysaccharide pyruvyl transferase family protein [Thermoleophilia bacterium]
MRFLLEHGEHQHRNRGDAAMLMVTAQRLREMWPQARLDVMTGDPGTLARLLPDATPVRTAPGGRLSRFRRSGPPPVASVDALVCVGGGYLTDADPDQTRRVLGTVLEAQALGTPVVMFGQGIGPLDDPELVELARRALPGVRMIALREGREGPAILARLGVPADAVEVTGDDAVRLARAVPAEGPRGAGIGVNHRLAAYLRTGDRDTELLREAVQAAATRHAAPLVAIPVSEWDDDRPGTATLTRGFPHVDEAPAGDADPAWAMRRLDRCRVVVTTTYHLAVFALARGVPVVCGAASEYYRLKFAGLADLFPGGCRVVALTAADAGAQLAGAIDEAWRGAPEMAAALQRDADRQVALADVAYRRAAALLRTGTPRDAAPHAAAPG